MNPILHIAVSLVLTVAVEGLVMLALFRSRRQVYYSALCNLLTNPAVNLLLMLYPLFAIRGYAAALTVLELAAVAAEALVYRRLCGWRFWRAAWVSLLLNACSFAAGTVFFMLSAR